jgi:hypothetical protein
MNGLAQSGQMTRVFMRAASIWNRVWHDGQDTTNMSLSGQGGA